MNGPATRRRPAPRLPGRDRLVRDGIPAEVMQHFREQARGLRAEAFRAAIRRLALLVAWAGARRRSRVVSLGKRARA